MFTRRFPRNSGHESCIERSSPAARRGRVRSRPCPQPSGPAAAALPAAPRQVSPAGGKPLPGGAGPRSAPPRCRRLRPKGRRAGGPRGAPGPLTARGGGGGGVRSAAPLTRPP